MRIGDSQPVYPSIATAGNPQRPPTIVASGAQSIAPNRALAAVDSVDRMLRTLGDRLHLRGSLQQRPCAVPAQRDTLALLGTALVDRAPAVLKRHVIRVFGSEGPSGVGHCSLQPRDELGRSTRPGLILGSINPHATSRYDIRTAGSAIPAANALMLDAHCVQTSVDTTFYRLPASSEQGPRLMITGQLSGCSLVVRAAPGGAVDVAHVRPGEAETGAQLHQRLCAELPGAVVFGASGRPGHYDAARRVVTVIGNCLNGEWRIYAQQQDATSGNYAIRSVHEIYPLPRRL